MFYVDIYSPYRAEQVGDVLKFYKDSNLIGELPIDKYDITIKDFEQYARICFHLKRLKIPIVIPKGYSSPKLIEGYYRVKDTRVLQKEDAYPKIQEIVGDFASDYVRELAYIDTSEIKEDEYFDLWRQYGYKNLSIPKSFWMQLDWRHWCGGHTNLSQTLSLIDNFDIENNSMCMTKNETCYLAYMKRRGRFQYREIEEEICQVFQNEPKKIFGQSVFYPYDIKSCYLPNDNWEVLSVDDKGNYILIGMDDMIEEVGSGIELIHERLVDFNTKATGMWGIPVIHETENLVKKSLYHDFIK